MKKVKIAITLGVVIGVVTINNKEYETYKEQREEAYVYCRDYGVAADCYEWSSSDMLKTWFDEGNTFEQFKKGYLGE